MCEVPRNGCDSASQVAERRLTKPWKGNLTGTQYLGIISFMDCSMCPKPIPEPRLTRRAPHADVLA